MTSNRIGDVRPVARIYPDLKRGRGNRDEGKKGAETAGFSYRRLALARTVLRYAPDLPDNVLTGPAP